MKCFVNPKELDLYPVVNRKLSESDIIRAEFQNDHFGYSVENRLEIDQNKSERIRRLFL